MTVETKVNVGGSWKTLVGIQVNVGGSWKTVDLIQSKVGSSWKTVFEVGGMVVQADITVSTSISGAQSQSGVRFQSAGCTDQIDNQDTIDLLPEGSWWSDEPETAIGADYEVREATHISGTWWAAAGGEGVWVNMSAGRNWFVLRTFGKGQDGPGTSTAIGDFEIRDIATETIQASFRLTASAIIT